MECVGGIFFPVAGFGRLCLSVGHGDGDFRSPTRELTVEHVGPVWNLGKHNLISTKRLTRVSDEPMHVYPAATVIRPRCSGKPLISRLLRRENGLLEIRVRRRNHTKSRIAKPLASSSLEAEKCNRRDIV